MVSVYMSVYVSHGVMRFNTMAKPAVVRIGMMVVKVVVIIYSSVLSSIRPSLQSLPVPCGASRGGGARAGKDRAEGGQGGEGPGGGGARQIHYAPGSH
jgi:hypothetical protein